MRLRTINKWLRRCGWVLIVQEFDEPEATERGRTGLRIEWIGLRGSRRRRAWDAKWMVLSWWIRLALWVGARRRG